MADWITDLIAGHGYLALFALMFLENVFPPIPSELMKPFAVTRRQEETSFTAGTPSAIRLRAG